MTESSQKSSTIASLEGAVQDHLATIAECNSRIRGDEMTRRKLHNTIQELKGRLLVLGYQKEISNLGSPLGVLSSLGLYKVYDLLFLVT